MRFLRTQERMVDGNDSDEEWNDAEYEIMLNTLKKTRETMNWDERPWEDHPMFMKEMPTVCALFATHTGH